MIAFERLTASYPRASAPAVNDVSLIAADGVFTAVVGPNGSGKSTLVRALLGRVPVVSGAIRLDQQLTSALSRREIARHVAVVVQREEPVFPMRVREYIALGKHPAIGAWQSAPDVEAAIDAAVDGHQFKPDIDTLVLDGIPRNVNQAKIMEAMIDVEKVFHLSCPNRETLFSRLKKRALKDNRLDDANEEVIQRRLAIYDEESKPVLSYYPKECVSVIDATQPPAKVLFDILASVNGLDGQHEPATV